MSGRLTLLLPVLILFISPFNGAAQDIIPDALAFKKTYTMPGIGKAGLYSYTAGWDYKALGLSSGGVVCGSENKGFRGRFYDIPFGDRKGNLYGTIILSFNDDGFDLIFKDITAQCRNISVDFFPSSNGRMRPFEKSARRVKMFAAARQAAECVFLRITASMEEYLKIGPPMELEIIE